MSPVLELRHVSKQYHQGAGELAVLRAVNLSIQQGEIVSLVGSSGCGKTTLLQLAGLLDKADQGEILINQHACQSLSQKAATMIRRNDLGFVYQFHHLLPEFTAVENIAMPLRIQKKSKKESLYQALDFMERLHISHLAHQLPSQLSGGEQQRVAIARSLVHQPSLLLADEPTGNLDNESTEQVFQLILSTVRELNLAALIVTHDPQLAARADTLYQLHDGELVNSSIM